MKLFDQNDFYLSATGFESLASLLGRSEKVTGELLDALGSSAQEMQRLCRKYRLSVSAGLFQRVVFLLEEGDAEMKIVHQACVCAHSALEEELRLPLFLYVAADMRLFYSSSKWHRRITKQFPDCALDIDEGGKCLALDRGTACAFHAMRIMESGLRALNNALGTPLGADETRDWTRMIKAIRTAIDNELDKTRKMFLEEVSAGLFSVKNAWRNRVMHLDKKYRAEDAFAMYSAATQFMGVLSRRIDMQGWRRDL